MTIPLVIGVTAGGALLVVAWLARRLIRDARQAGTRLDLALSGARMATWEWNVRTHTMRFWEGSESVFGQTWISVDSAWSCVHPEDMARIRQEVETAMRSKARFRHVNRIVRQDNGEVRWIETRAQIERNAQGEPIHITGVAIDVTERQLALDAALEAERALQRDNRRKDEFLAMLSHELRNPLAPIRYAAAVVNETATPAVLRRARDVIERQSVQLAGLLDDLLDLSRIRCNVIELAVAPLDLRGLLGQALENAEPLVERAQQRLVQALPAEAVWVRGDPRRLLQVFGNLLDNAVKYTGPGGRIEVSLTSGADRARIEVTDTGIGLGADMLPRVFDLFAQVHRPLGMAQGGLGIGLTVVKRLVELHGGHVEVTSPGLGRGSTFRVILPRSAEPAGVRADTADPAVTPLTQRPRILIVDDNPDITESLGLLLRAEGFPTAIAVDGRSALAQFESTNPVLVLLDLGLPDMHGTEVARAIRRCPHGRAVPIIAISGWGQEADRQRTQAAGVTRHLVKPVEPASLLVTIREVLLGTSASERVL